jgi:hypothetical protein
VWKREVGFQPETRGDIIWRYTKAQEQQFKRKGELQRGISTK